MYSLHGFLRERLDGLLAVRRPPAKLAQFGVAQLDGQLLCHSATYSLARAFASDFNDVPVSGWASP
ncbi:MAG: hypothetical protein WDN24_00860 [Sphingomonas sp.]